MWIRSFAADGRVPAFLGSPTITGIQARVFSYFIRSSSSYHIIRHFAVLSIELVAIVDF